LRVTTATLSSDLEEAQEVHRIGVEGVRPHDGEASAINHKDLADTLARDRRRL
jgi:hypothetical protein